MIVALLFALVCIPILASDSASDSDYSPDYEYGPKRKSKKKPRFSPVAPRCSVTDDEAAERRRLINREAARKSRANKKAQLKRMEEVVMETQRKLERARKANVILKSQIDYYANLAEKLLKEQQEAPIADQPEPGIKFEFLPALAQEVQLPAPLVAQEISPPEPMLDEPQVILNDGEETADQPLRNYQQELAEFRRRRAIFLDTFAPMADSDYEIEPIHLEATRPPDPIGIPTT